VKSPERKEKKLAERRSRIMENAKKAILAHGADGVSMQDIADAAGVSKASLYSYFPGKEALFTAICDEATSVFFESARGRITDGSSALETLAAYWRCFTELFGKSEELLIIFRLRSYLVPSSPFVPSNLPTKPSFAFYYAIKDLMERGIAEGVFDTRLNSESLARMVLSLFSSAIPPDAMPGESRNTERNTERNAGRNIDYIAEIKNEFTVLLRGIAAQDIDRSLLILPDG
jgi:AcrR family transcriptional regulator